MPQERLRVGNVEILALSDGLLEFDPCAFFPTVPAAQWAPYTDHLTAEHRVRFNLGSFLLRSQGKTILVDTGLGPVPAGLPAVTWGKLLEDLAAHAVRPEDVDMVVLTHLHRDHVGWNLSQQEGKVVPTFPNARYWLSAKDWEACHQEALRERFPNAPTCVWPLAELGLVEFMEGEYTLTQELTAVPTPGHTPGHMSLLVTSQGERALILGDVMHSPAQVQEPDWASRADIDPDLARETRRALLERLEREGTLVAAGHFPPPGFGRIVRLANRRYWQGL
ncbi:MAG: MBL fold metallo-hydrolase [Candidatus Tectimicrobiota bacterium]|nr:MAG: MBL fold metallo-hydrolase [Candidatus Tectomicrobia bacterium]